MAIKGRRATYEERVSACEALESGISADEVAKVLKVSRASIFEWQKDVPRTWGRGTQDEEDARP
jgi:transposase